MGTSNTKIQGTQKPDAKSYSMHDKITEHAKKKEYEPPYPKLLILGVGESGKSTIFRQMTLIYEKGFTEKERKEVVKYIHLNMLEAMKLLLKFTNNDAELKNRRSVNKNDQDVQEGKGKTEDEKAEGKENEWDGSVLRDDDFEYFEEYKMNGKRIEDDRIWNILRIVWSSKEFKHWFTLNAHKFQIPSGFSYYMDKIDTVSKKKWVPDDIDLLRMRIRTTGIASKLVEINDTKVSFVDVGGQRNERRKWIHLFDNVTAVLFVVAISEFDQNCFEDDSTNRMEESLNTWKKIVKNPYFEDKPFILFFNKMDIFKDKFTKFPNRMKERFPEFGKLYPENRLEDALKFWKDKFLEIDMKVNNVHTFYTSAVDGKIMKDVLEDLANMFIQKYQRPL